MAAYPPIIPTGPAREAEAVTASDTTPYSGDRVARALYVGDGGDVVILPYGQTQTVTFVNVPGGTVLPIWHTRIASTDTTATSMVAMF